MPNLLKSLELNGFKSFASRTVLEFPDGITAIVGPNGSGKSNIMDAIRWLLGERDARNLRGAKTEDMIFAGTRERARLGQAQASLNFSNESGFFPAEYSEIAVSRTVSRDGASRYFLNKSEVRLKDIVDFFARSRLGARGLVVITQGNSDVFIQAGPSERRAMIEEILGLREYQLKKAEAERKLQNAEINLGKAEALAEEILPHLRSLRRQTSRWEKRGSLEEHLKNLENDFFAYQLGQIGTADKAVDSQLKIREDEFERLAAERKKAEDALREAESRQPKEREELEKIKFETRKLLDQKGKLQKDIGRLEGAIESVSKNPAAGPGYENLLEIIAEIESVLRGAGETAESLRAAAAKAIKLAESVRTIGKNKMIGERDNMSAQMDSMQKDLAALDGELEKLKKKEDELGENQESFYKFFRLAVSRVESAKDKIEKWQTAQQELALQKERLKFRREEIEKQISQAGRRREEFAGIAAKGAIDLAQTERDIFKIRGELANMGEIDPALQKEAAETEKRYSFLKSQLEDLVKSKADLESLICDLKEKIKTEFERSLKKINAEFSELFGLMFDGGQASLKVGKRRKTLRRENEDREDVTAENKEGEEQEETEEGIEIEVKLPRKRIASLEMLSGGERSLVGIAALFALISVSPPPFLVLDEIDAALDERNARRFSELIGRFCHRTQFIIVTHNRVTMESANILYGITMNKDGTSKVVSLKLEPAVQTTE